VAPPQPAAFLAAIESALAVAADPAAIQRRRAVAEEADWSTRLERMCALLDEKLVAARR
jgi:uncharacterized protein (DUF885 family)